MEKDIGKIKKNSETDVVIRIDDFGGRVGLTIREFTTSENYKGFTKSGTRIPAESFGEFKKLINSIDEKDLTGVVSETNSSSSKPASSSTKPQKNLTKEEEESYL